MFAFAEALSNPERWVYGLLGLAVITWGGHWLAQRLNHGLAITRDNRSRRSAAKAAFHSAVLAELGSIYPSPAAWPQDINTFLRSKFTALQAAVENFSPSVPRLDRWGFDRAWLRYCCSTGRECDKNTYHHYMGSHAPGEPPPDVKAIFRANVERLLSYAKKI